MITHGYKVYPVFQGYASGKNILSRYALQKWAEDGKIHKGTGEILPINGNTEESYEEDCDYTGLQ